MTKLYNMKNNVKMPNVLNKIDDWPKTFHNG